MKIFISPAMGFNEEAPHGLTKPIYLDRALIIRDILKDYTPSQISSLMGCSTKIAEENCVRYNTFNKDLCALFAFSGIAYKALDAKTLDSKSIEYLYEHLYIGSGLYAILRADNSITPYRLEMKTKLDVSGSKNLYNFWQDSLYKAIATKDKEPIINLASKEYSDCIEKYIQDETYVTCTFKQEKAGKLRTYSTAAKKARGLMTRWIAENKIEDYCELTRFCEDGYIFEKDLSDTSSQFKELVFVKYEIS